MAKVDELKVGLKIVDVEETTVICRAVECKHNMSRDTVNPYAGCRFKQVYNVGGGQCQHYEARKIGEDQ